ncbi:M23 family metallopeptidase [Roseibium sp. M-1]
MVEWPHNQDKGSPGQRSHRPEFDRTIIVPARGKHGSAAMGQPSDPPAPKPPRPPAAPPKPARRRSPLGLYAALAAGCLVLGGAVGGVAHLITSGAISFSEPKFTGGQEIAANQPEEPVAVEAGDVGADDPIVEDTPVPPQDSDTTLANDEELDIPADPFFDMALSAVIPLAGDPVLLGGGAANTRIELTERPVPDSASGSGPLAIPAVVAYVLDSEMLDENGDLVIRAPGSEADFQFGNFGGGEQSADLQVEEEPDATATSPDLPVFLKPDTDTLNLYMSERPIGQGPSRIEVKMEVPKATALKEFLKTNGFDEEVLDPLVDYARNTFSKSDLVAGDKIAVRGVRMPNKVGRIGDYYRPVQMSIYAKDGYLGTASYSPGPDGGSYVGGADPWFGKTIVQEKVANDQKAAPAKSIRLIDGLYATAVRNAVPASIVGEAIAYLAPTTDLKRDVKPDERFMLIFTDSPRDEKRGGGRVLFAGVRQGDNWSVRCYVLKAPGNRGFACVNEGGKVSVSGAMLVPVKGVLTSKFGMRFHPIKKIERLHAGVDWAAPSGTPIHAAFSGKVTYRDVRGGYGNFIELTHKDGITSRYAHMLKFADGIELGSVVQAGDLIGYIGTTGLSTGPHLHFEIRHRGEPTDPLAFEMETGADAPQSVASNDLQGYRAEIAEILTVQ